MPKDHVTSPQFADQATADAFQDNMQRIALVESERQTQQRANAIGFGYINLVGFPIGPETISIVPRAVAEQLRAICFLKTSTEIRVGVVDAAVLELPSAIEEIRRKYHANVEIYLISQHSYETAVRMYDRLPKIIPQADELRLTTEDILRQQKNITDVRHLDNQVQNASITDTFIVLIAAALSADASDIHVEAEADGVRVRLRLDGVLTPVATLPTERWPRIVARIKLLARLKLNVTAMPQDGRVTIFLPEEKVDIRVSTLPTAFGESVVMRLLRSSATTVRFSDLGLRGLAQKRLEEAIQKPNGMVVITGPTGSGKTTTLYAVMRQLNSPETKIITLEDPIEYKLEGINQSQVDWAKGYTFATGLRSILRQDPDIIMVGEIRDLETAETSVQAALTGHLVLSTIHTNDAAGAVPRFLSMGTKPYLLAPALNVVVAQRLVRKLCTACAKTRAPDAATSQKIQTVLAAVPASAQERPDPARIQGVRAAVGCEACHGTGYRGRIGIFEVLVVDADVEKLILTGAVSEFQVRQIAEQQGMLTMVQDGILKALDGLTSVDEVFRVAQ